MLNLDWHFFPVFDRFDPASAYRGTYDLGLVITSVAIAILAAFVALSISGRIAAAATPRARYACERRRDQHGRRHLGDAFCRHAGLFAALRDHI